MYETKLPVVYLANDYSKEEEPQANVSAFEQFVSSEGIEKTVCLPPVKIQSDGNSTIIKWRVPDLKGDYEDSMRVNKTFEEVVTLIKQVSEVNL